MLFALAAVVLYYLFPKRLRQYVLLATSILFYLTYGVRMAGYLAATILLTYLFGLWLDRLAAFRPAAETKEERKRQKRANDRKKRRVLALSLVLNFASLALLKYGGFLAAAVNSVLGTENRTRPPQRISRRRRRRCGRTTPCRSGRTGCSPPAARRAAAHRARG